MAAVSSLLPAPLSGPRPGSSGSTPPATAQRSRSSSRSRGASTAALALPVVPLVPARPPHTRLFPLNSMLQTPRSSAAALAATAAADAATAAAAAACAAAVAAAAAGAVSAADRAGFAGRDYGHPDVQRENLLRLVPRGTFISYQNVEDATEVVSEEAAAVPEEAAAADLPAEAQSASTGAAGATERSSACASGKEKTAAVAAGGSNAQLSLACRLVHQRCAEATAGAAVGDSSSLARDETLAEQMCDAAGRMAICEKAHPGPVKSPVQPKGKPLSLSRTHSCFSSFSLKTREKPTSNAVSWCAPGNSAAGDVLQKTGNNNSNDRGSNCAGQNSNNSLCAGSALLAPAAALCDEENHQQAEICQRGEERKSVACNGGPRVVPATREEIDVQPKALDRNELVSRPQDPLTGRRTTCETSHRESLPQLPAMAAAAADATCCSVETPARHRAGSSDAYSSNSCPRAGSSGGNYEYRSNMQKMRKGSTSNSSSVYGSDNVCSRPTYGSSSSYGSGGRDGNIFVLGSARQVTPESSRISSRMSCGGDDAALAAHLDFLSAHATAAAGRRGGAAVAAAEAAGRSAATAAGRGLTETPREAEGVKGLEDALREKNNVKAIFQRRRGSKKHSAFLCLEEKEQQQQHQVRQECRSHQQVPTRCVSMPEELDTACEGANRRQPGFPCTLTPREVLQLRQQQQRKKSEEGQEKTPKNVLTSKYLLSSMKLDLLKLRKAEKENALSTSAASSAVASRLRSGGRAGIFYTPREDFTRRDTNSERSSSVRSCLSSVSASSSSSSVVFNSGEAAASVVALTGSSPRAADAPASNASSSSSSSLSTPLLSFSSSLVAPSSFSALAASLACKGKNFLSTVLPSLVLLVEPPTEEAAAPRQDAQKPAEISEAAVDDDVHTQFYADLKEANISVATAAQPQYFSDWAGYHGLSPLDAIEEAEERKATLHSEGDGTSTRIPSIVVQGADEVDLLRGTSFRRDTIVRHSLARAKDLWEKILSCCW